MNNMIYTLNRTKEIHIFINEKMQQNLFKTDKIFALILFEVFINVQDLKTIEFYFEISILPAFVPEDD